MKTVIATYLQQGPEGKFYYRMVDTVLSRDKNWVRWKAENCPPIERPPISGEEFVEAENSAQKASANKRLRATPLGSLDISFLSDAETSNGLERLKDPDRQARHWSSFEARANIFQVPDSDRRIVPERN